MVLVKMAAKTIHAAGHLAGKKILNKKALYLQKITKRFQEMIKRQKAKNTLKNFSE